MDDFPGEFPPVKEESSLKRANQGYFQVCPHCTAYLFSATRLPALYKTAGEIKPITIKRKFTRVLHSEPDSSRAEPVEPAPKEKGTKRKKPRMA